MAKIQLEIVETDGAGKPTATYVQTAGDKRGESRIDVILPDVAKSIWTRILDLFLPAGYPHSVTDDYMEYQIYDSLQAFTSSIAGLLSSRAVLSSVGVGDSSASPTAALLLSIFQASIGRIATILFAHRLGQALEPECKMYRFLADILNDMAFVLDCLSPYTPKPFRVLVLGVASMLRALCGVAATSAKASLSAHFARWGNLAELNAKDSSQETVISLLGMLAGSLVVSVVKTPAVTWTVLMLLLAIHLETNRRAVRAVCMRTLNRQRATLVYHHLARGHVPTPKEVAQEERIFERDGVLRSREGRIRGHCEVGISILALFRCLNDSSSGSGAMRLPDDSVLQILKIYERRGCVVWYEERGGKVLAKIFVKRAAEAKDLLLAWWQVNYLVARIEGEREDEKDASSLWDYLYLSLDGATKILQENEQDLRDAGWELDLGALETTATARFELRA